MSHPLSINIGRWRPVQGLMQTYAVYSGIRGLIAGPVPGQALDLVLGNDPDFITYIFYVSLLVGGLAAMAGEIMQLKATRNTFLIKADKLLDGLFIESGGDFLIALNYFALAIAIFNVPVIAWERAIVYIMIGCGFIFRFCQALLDVKRVRINMREAGINV